MHELTAAQMRLYRVDRIGIGQVNILCGSVVVSRLVDEDKLQRAINGIFRINDGLRSHFVEKDGVVLQDCEPFEERRFEVLHFQDKAELDAWGNRYATIPLKLPIRTEGGGIPKSHWRTQKSSPALVRSILAHNARTLATCKRYHIHVEPSCCEAKIVYLPDACGVILKMHHIVSDAWTMLLVGNQFLRLLKGEEVTTYRFEEYLGNVAAYHGSKRYERDAAYF